ncbi:MAG: hypothetical protein JWN21_2733 [Sphingomonas bacterium]|uniref:hypothetical protein n=1 Tax=Sphingomonas bacterium TaxID=1895847 RepID=UPI00260A1938|nr:hypothetical protein [Sphingomonas bacterium]MDB5697190.1 hypothetical protein [Sphingomonas bacterium]
MRILLPSLLFIAACTPTARDLERQADAEAGARAALDRELAGLVPGRTQACVNQTELRGGLKSFGNTLVYSNGGSTKYVNRTTGGCERVGHDAILVTRTSSPQLCRGDIGRTIDRGSHMFAGSCGFGDFVRYQRPSRGS